MKIESKSAAAQKDHHAQNHHIIICFSTPSQFLLLSSEVQNGCTENKPFRFRRENKAGLHIQNNNKNVKTYFLCTICISNSGTFQHFGSQTHGKLLTKLNQGHLGRSPPCLCQLISERNERSLWSLHSLTFILVQQHKYTHPFYTYIPTWNK